MEAAVAGVPRHEADLRPGLQQQPHHPVVASLGSRVQGSPACSIYNFSVKRTGDLSSPVHVSPRLQSAPSSSSLATRASSPAPEAVNTSMAAVTESRPQLGESDHLILLSSCLLSGCHTYSDHYY